MKRRGAVKYYVGFLYTDRETDRALAKLADEYYMKYVRGRGTLVQRRLGAGQYEYWFVPWDLAEA